MTVMSRPVITPAARSTPDETRWRVVNDPAITLTCCSTRAGTCWDVVNDPQKVMSPTSDVMASGSRIDKPHLGYRYRSTITAVPVGTEATAMSTETLELTRDQTATIDALLCVFGDDAHEMLARIEAAYNRTLMPWRDCVDAEVRTYMRSRYGH